METRAIYRARSGLGAGVAWDRAEAGSWEVPGSLTIARKPRLPREREERRGVGGPGLFSKRYPIPTPGSSRALQVRLDFWAYAGRSPTPTLSLGLLRLCAEGQ